MNHSESNSRSSGVGEALKDGSIGQQHFENASAQDIFVWMSIEGSEKSWANFCLLRRW